MKWGVVVFPGSNDDRDSLHAISDILGDDAVVLWHGEGDLKGVDTVLLPGGFSYGDYRSEEHTSELQSHSFISYAVFCLKKKKLL